MPLNGGSNSRRAGENRNMNNLSQMIAKCYRHPHGETACGSLRIAQQRPSVRAQRGAGVSGDEGIAGNERLRLAVAVGSLPPAAAQLGAPSASLAAIVLVLIEGRKGGLRELLGRFLIWQIGRAHV